MKNHLYLLFFIFLLSCNSKKSDGPKYKRNKKIITYGEKDFKEIPAITGYKKKVPPFPFYNGVTTIPSFKVGTNVWSPVPVAGKWKIVNYSISKVIKIKETNVYLKNLNTEFMVPGAMAIEAIRPKKRLKKGMFVLVRLGMTSGWGKIEKTSKNKVSVSMIMGSELEEAIFPLNNILLLEPGKYLPGTPIAFKSGKRWESGQLIHSTKRTAWIIGYAGKLNVVSRTMCRINNFKYFKKNRRVWSPWYDLMEEAKVRKVINNGTGYLIEFVLHPKEKYRNPRIVSFAHVMKAIE